MTARFFIDTNILLYAGSSAAPDRVKRAIAENLLLNDEIGFSAQVLQEYYDVAVRKKRIQISHGEAVAVIQSLLAYPVVPISGELVLRATEKRMRFKISYWDAAILAAAEELGCEMVYSEDFNHGQDYDGIKAQNPFV